MRKIIASTIVVILLTGTIVLLLSSCSLFVKQDYSAATSNEFAGNVVYKKIEINPVSAESHYTMGCHFQKQKKHDWAIEEFQAAIASKPSYVEAYNRLGVSYDLTGQFEKALAAYGAALSVNQDLDYVHNNMGYSYLLQGQYDLAAASFQKAIALNPEKSRYRNNLATAYVKSGQDSAAIAAFNTNNDEAKAHLKVARVYYRDGEYEKAEAYYKKAARLKPKYSQVKKELTAAVSMAEIHAARDTDDPVDPKTTTDSTQSFSSRYDKDGYYTVPVVPVQDFDNTDTVVAITDTDFEGTSGVTEKPYIVAEASSGRVLSTASPAVEKPLLLNRLQLLTEAQIRENLKSSIEDTDTYALKRVKIEVSNGNGVRHMAKEVGHFLKEQNVVIMYLSNADHFNYNNTSIYYTKGNLNEAFRLSQKLPGRQQLQQVDEIRDGHADITVLIGNDLVSHRDALKES